MLHDPIESLQEVSEDRQFNRLKPIASQSLAYACNAADLSVREENAQNFQPAQPVCFPSQLKLHGSAPHRVLFETRCASLKTEHSWHQVAQL